VVVQDAGACKEPSLLAIHGRHPMGEGFGDPVGIPRLYWGGLTLWCGSDVAEHLAAGGLEESYFAAYSVNDLQQLYNSYRVKFAGAHGIRPQGLARGARRKVVNLIRFVLADDVVDTFLLEPWILNYLDPLSNVEDVVKIMTRHSSYDTIALGQKKLS
jgi:hypothetical protein